MIESRARFSLCILACGLCLCGQAASASAAAAKKPAKEKPTRAKQAADDPAVLQKKARARMANLDFEQALPLLQQALDAKTLGPSKRAELLVDLGISLVSLARNDEARQAFDDAVASDPAVALPVGAAPKIRALFESVREARLNPPKPAPKVIEARVEPPALPPPEKPAPPPPPEVKTVVVKEHPLVVPIILEVAAAGALAAGIVTGSSSRSAANDLRSGLHSGADAESLRSRQQTMATVSIVTYSVAGAAAVSGLLVFLLAGSEKTVSAGAAITGSSAAASVSVKF